MIMHIKYENGSTENHKLKNGVHFADFNGTNDVPGSKQAFKLGGQQVRYLIIVPGKKEIISSIDLVKASNRPDRPGGYCRRLRVIVLPRQSVRALREGARPWRLGSSDVDFSRPSNSELLPKCGPGVI